MVSRPEEKLADVLDTVAHFIREEAKALREDDGGVLSAEGAARMLDMKTPRAARELLDRCRVPRVELSEGVVRYRRADVLALIRRRTVSKDYFGARPVKLPA